MLKHYIIILLSISTLAYSANITFNSQPPAVDSNDISNFTGAITDLDNVGSSTTNGNANDGSTYIANDRGAQGQTFTTGNDAEAYTVNSISIQHTGYSENTVTTWYNISSGSVFTIRITSPEYSGTTGFVIDSETCTISGSESNIFALNSVTNTENGTGTWVTFEFDTPIVLAPDTTYGFDISTTSGSFFETLGIKDSATNGNPYSAGQAYVSGSSGSGNNSLSILQWRQSICHKHGNYNCS